MPPGYYQAPNQAGGWAQPGSSTAPPGPPAPPKRAIYKRWWFWLIVVLVLAWVVNALGGSSDSTENQAQATATQTAATESQPTSGDTATEATAAATAAEPPASTNAGVGTPVAAGDLTFTVVAASSTTVLQSPLGSKEGNWIVLDVVVQNNGKDAVTVNDSQITLVTPDGATYETDSDSMTYIDSDRWLFLEKINPGLSKEGTVLIAVGPDVTSGTVAFESSMFGGKTAKVDVSVA